MARDHDLDPLRPVDVEPPTLLGQLRPGTRAFLRALQGEDPELQRRNVAFASVGVRLELLTYGLSRAEQHAVGEMHVLTPLGRAVIAALAPLTVAERDDLAARGEAARKRLSAAASSDPQKCELLVVEPARTTHEFGLQALHDVTVGEPFDGLLQFPVRGADRSAVIEVSTTERSVMIRTVEGSGLAIGGQPLVTGRSVMLAIGDGSGDLAPGVGLRSALRSKLRWL
jgi:hypothetical protein